MYYTNFIAFMEDPQKDECAIWAERAKSPPRNHHYLIKGGLLFEKESPKSYSKGLRETFLCRLEVYRTAIFLNLRTILLRKRASLERNTPKIGERRSYYPSIFLVSLCFTRQSVKVVKAKSAKLLYVRARERVRDSIRMPSLPILFGCASRETERGITISVL